MCLNWHTFDDIHCTVIPSCKNYIIAAEARKGIEGKHHYSYYIEINYSPLTYHHHLTSLLYTMTYINLFIEFPSRPISISVAHGRLVRIQRKLMDYTYPETVHSFIHHYAGPFVTFELCGKTCVWLAHFTRYSAAVLTRSQPAIDLRGVEAGNFTLPQV